MDEQYRAWRRWLYATVALGMLLVIQLPLVARPQPQPYPGIVLPGFRETSNGPTLIREHLLTTMSFEDGTTEELDLYDLMDGVRQSAVLPIAERVLTEERVPASTVDWLEARAERLFPERRPVAITICVSEVTIDLEAAEATDATCESERTVRLD